MTATIKQVELEKIVAFDHFVRGLLAKPQDAGLDVHLHR